MMCFSLDLSIYAEPRSRYAARSSDLRRRRVDGLALEQTRTMDRVVSAASSVFVLGSDLQRRNSVSTNVSQLREFETKDMLALSKHATLGRNSDFSNLTREDREKLGGIEYRSLKLLVKVVFGKIIISIIRHDDVTMMTDFNQV
jgi:hypothetical protein